MRTARQLLVIGYPSRLLADHRALLAAAGAAGFEAELVSPSRLGLEVSPTGEQVVLDGLAPLPDQNPLPDRGVLPEVVLPRGVNRPWPLLRQVLACWQRAGVRVVPDVAAAEFCADKLVTTRALVAAGVPVLPTVGVAPGPGVVLPGGIGTGELVAKPARASKAAGVERYSDPASAQAALGTTRSLLAGLVDHHVVQPLATGAGTDYRVIVARVGHRVLVPAVTRRHASAGGFVTDGEVEDVHDPWRDVPEVVEVATRAVLALGLAFGGVDVIEHEGRAVVLEVNAWPGLAAEVRGWQLAEVLVEVAASEPAP